MAYAFQMKQGYVPTGYNYSSIDRVSWNMDTSSSYDVLIFVCTCTLCL